MSALALVQNNDLMTVQQLAEKYEVSARTIRRWIADAELDAAELQLPVTGGKPIPLYSGSQMDAYVQSIDAQGLKSETSKLKFMIGHIELEGTPEQRDAIRDVIDDLHAQITRISNERDRAEDAAINNAAEYMKLLRYVPDKYKSKEQRDWEVAPTFSQILKRHGLRGNNG